MRPGYCDLQMFSYIKAQVLKTFYFSFPLLKPVLSRIVLILLFFVPSTRMVRLS